jgi:hypothetical protein
MVFAVVNCGINGIALLCAAQATWLAAAGTQSSFLGALAVEGFAVTAWAAGRAIHYIVAENKIPQQVRN